jgi:hypothetical protein
VGREKIFPSERYVLSVSIPETLHERIRAYRVAKQFDNEDEAVLDLIERGFAADAGEPRTVKVDLQLREDRD